MVRVLLPFLLLATTSRAAQPTLPDQLARCATIASAVQRLDCFDGLARTLQRPERAVGTRAPPRFEDFPASVGPPARNAPLILTPQQMMFRTRLRDGASQAPDFAGHYIMVTWGCGTECINATVINARTGRAIPVPVTVCCPRPGATERADMINYRADSRLLFVSGTADSNVTGDHFFRVEGDRLIHVGSVPRGSAP